MSDDLSGFSMMDLFRMEADERLTVLSQGLVALEGSSATSGGDRALDARGAFAERRGANRGAGRGGAGGACHGRLPGRRAEGFAQAPVGAYRHAAPRGRSDGAGLAGSGGRAGGLAVIAWRGGRHARGRPGRRAERSTSGTDSAEPSSRARAEPAPEVLPPCVTR